MDITESPQVAECSQDKLGQEKFVEEILKEEFELNINSP